MKTESNDLAVAKDTMRNQVLKVARDIFTKYGFKKTTIDDIARELQKGKSSLYYYFTSKEELYKAVLDQEAGELKDQILGELAKTDNAREKVSLYIKSRLEGIKKLGNLYDFRKSQYLSLDNAVALREKYDKLELDIIRNLLEYGVAKGSFSIENIEATATTMLIIVKGLEMPVLSQNREILNQRVEELLPVLFFGICKC
ncbi:MAG: TetR/AcrR family transcriptional regulator [Salinivirgaceae bacterium]